MLPFRPTFGTPSSPVVASTEILPSTGAWAIASAYVVRSMGIASSSLVVTNSRLVPDLIVCESTLACRHLTAGNRRWARQNFEIVWGSLTVARVVQPIDLPGVTAA